MERCQVPVMRLLFSRLLKTECSRNAAVRTSRYHILCCSSKGKATLLPHISICSKISSHYFRRPTEVCNFMIGKLCTKNAHVIADSITYNKPHCDRFQPFCDICWRRKSRIHSYSRLNTDFTKSSSSQFKTNRADASESDSDKEDVDFKPALEAVTPNIEPPQYINIVPGKGPPPEPPIDCCMSGCANCVWIQYCEELKRYFTDDVGNEKAKQAIENIENPGLQMFLKLELGFM